MSMFDHLALIANRHKQLFCFRDDNKRPDYNIIAAAYRKIKAKEELNKAFILFNWTTASI